MSRFRLCLGLILCIAVSCSGEPSDDIVIVDVDTSVVPPSSDLGGKGDDGTERDSSVNVAPDGGPDSAPDLVSARVLSRSVLELDPGEIERIAGFDPGVRARVANTTFEEMTYEVDGLAVKGFVLTPVGRGPFPAIIYNRGGNGDFGAIGESILLFWISRFASWGYVVVASQYRGNAGGEGAEEFGGADVNDVLGLIDILDQEPNVDASRIGMYGHSRGGLMTYLSLSRTDRVRAAVVDAGVSDSILWVEERPEIEEVYEMWVPDYDARRDEALLERSPARWPERMADVPFLLLHGDADARVGIEHARKMNAGLLGLGRDVELVEYPGGDHALGEVADDVTSRIRAHMAAHVTTR